MSLCHGFSRHIDTASRVQVFGLKSSSVKTITLAGRDGRRLPLRVPPTLGLSTPARGYTGSSSSPFLPFLASAGNVGAPLLSVRTDQAHASKPPGSSRLAWAPWLHSRTSSFVPSSTVGLAAFWVRVARASRLSAWPFEPQGLSRGGQI